MAREPLRVLLIQSWVIRGPGIREALRASGYDPTVYRIDVEAAVAAALSRSTYDLVLLDSTTTSITRVGLEILFRELGLRIPIIEIVGGRCLGDEVRAALAANRN